MRPTLLFLFWSCVAPAIAQRPGEEAAQLLRQFLRDTLSAPEQYLTGEALGQGFDPRQIPPSTTWTTEVLEADSAQAVVAMTFTDSADVQDVYAHMGRTSEGWRIRAFRALALPGFFYLMLERTAGMDRAALERYHEQQNAVMDPAERTSFDDFVYELQRDSLTIASDAALAAHFLKHRAAFEELDRRVQAEHMDPSGYVRVDDAPYRAQLHDLLISTISNGALEKGLLTEYIVGGILDNSVGYLHCPDPALLPAMSDDGYIMIKCIAPGWYLFKTT